MEEDIKVLERFIKVCDEDLFTEVSIKCDGLTRNAIQNLLTNYKQLEEENEKIKMENSTLKANYEIGLIAFRKLKKNSIPKSKVKEKIEELSEEFNKINTSENNEWYIDSEKYAFIEEVLEELLGEE